TLSFLPCPDLMCGLMTYVPGLFMLLINKSNLFNLICFIKCCNRTIDIWFNFDIDRDLAINQTFRMIGSTGLVIVSFNQISRIFAHLYFFLTGLIGTFALLSAF